MLNNLYHLGKLYEAKRDLERAMEFYLKGFAIQTLGKNPCEQAISDLKKREGNPRSSEHYVAAIQEDQRRDRKRVVLSSRIQDPEAAPAFELETLDGKRISLESLKGKIVVINYWGIWCGWCIKEMPDYQKLHENYQDDAGVVILTIDNDPFRDKVPIWMQRNGYTFPVLLDDGYVRKVKVRSFPTTWFIDREGRIAFVKRGWTKDLVDEFSWCIEALRTDGL